MSADDVLQTVIDLDEAFNRGDLEGVLTYYHDDATMVVEPGHLAYGKREIRSVFERLLSLGMKASQERSCTLQSGDTALFLSRWTLRLPGGGSRQMVATSVFRRGADGAWRVQVDNAFGPEILSDSPTASAFRATRALPAGAGEALQVGPTRVLCKVDGKETGGRFALITTEDPPKAGPPLHVHAHEDEALLVLEGEYQFQIGDQRLRGGPGTLALLRRGEPHTYQYTGTGTGRLMALITPAGFEEFFRRVDAAFQAGNTAPQAMMAFGEEHGVRFVGPPLGE